MYYISRYIEDKICLKGTKLGEKSKKLSPEELEEFAKSTTVIGYNKLTHNIKISSVQDVVNHLKSKQKLLDEKDYRLNTRVMNNKEVLSCEVGYIIEPCKDKKDVCNVRLLLPKYISDEVTVSVIDWDSIFVGVVDYGYEIIDNIVFDFELPEYAVGCPYITSSMELEFLRVNNITFTDKFNMNRVRGCSKMFYFEDTTPDGSDYNFRTCDISLENCIDTIFCTIDLSKYTANNLRDTTEMFKGFGGEILCPKLNTLDLVDDMFKGCSFKNATSLSYINNVIPTLMKRFSSSVMHDIGIKRLELDELNIVEFYEIYKFMGRCNIRVLIIDNPVSELEEVINSLTDEDKDLSYKTVRLHKIRFGKNFRNDTDKEFEIPLIFEKE